jgi:hypothetical protein
VSIGADLEVSLSAHCSIGAGGVEMLVSTQLHTGQRPVSHEQVVGIGAGPRGPQSRSQAKAPGCDRSEFASERARRRASESDRLAIEAMMAANLLSRSPMRAG